MDSVFFSLANKGLRFSLRIQTGASVLYEISRRDPSRDSYNFPKLLERRGIRVALERKKGGRGVHVRLYLRKVQDEMQLISFLGQRNGGPLFFSPTLWRAFRIIRRRRLSNQPRSLTPRETLFLPLNIYIQRYQRVPRLYSSSLIEDSRAPTFRPRQRILKTCVNRKRSTNN